MAIAGIFAVAILLSSGISWVMLEIEEDACGVHAWAAALAGADFHREITDHGSALTWSAADGYWSHRD